MDKNIVKTIPTPTGAWTLKFEGKFGFTYGFTLTGGKRCSLGRYQIGLFGRTSDLAQAIDRFENEVRKLQAS